MAAGTSEILVDPMFNQRYRFTREGNVVHTEIWVEPGGGVNLDHVHPHQEERLTEVVEGELVYRIDGDERTMRPGDTATVPRGVPHAFRNDGPAAAYVRFESEPPMELEESVKAGIAMGESESFTGGGIPKTPGAMMAAAEFAERYKETTRLMAPIPWFVQQVVNPPLAFLGRRFRR